MKVTRERKKERETEMCIYIKLLEHEESLSEGSPSPTVSRFDSNDQKIYGTNAMEEDSVVVKCKTCERPILANSFQAHSGRTIDTVSWHCILIVSPLETCGKAGKGNKKPRALTQLSTNDKSKLGKEIFSDDDDDDDDDDGDDEPLAKRQLDGQHKKKQAKQADASGKDGLDRIMIRRILTCDIRYTHYTRQTTTNKCRKAWKEKVKEEGDKTKRTQAKA